MTRPLPTRAVLFFALAASAALAQTTAPPATTPSPAAESKPARHHTRQSFAQLGPNLDLILLDPAHGGQDSGAHLAPNLLEKDLNLAFAQRLRAALAAHGFTVLLTRESDPQPQPAKPNPDPTQPPIPAPQPPQLTLEARAELANRAHPLACLMLHTTVAGRGIHLYTASLAPVAAINPATPLDQRPIQLWDSAQAASLPQSQRLSADLAQAFRNLSLPVLTGAASTGPIDSMTCAAVTLEVAPAPSGSALTPPSDPGYQDRLVSSLVEALQLYRSRIVSAQPQPAAAAPPTPAAAKPKARPRPKPVTPAVAPPDPAGAPR